jgi:hypothetical protein
MSFRSVFLAVAIAFALILAVLLVNRARPKIESEHEEGLKEWALL